MDLARSVGAIPPPSLLSRVCMTSRSTRRTGIGFCRSSVFFAAIAERLFGFGQYACETLLDVLRVIHGSVTDT